jgi:hypothetical protein
MRYVLIAVVVCALAGCSGFGLEVTKQQDPNSPIVAMPVDTTGDGTIDAEVWFNADTKAVMLDPSGQPSEVKGSREKYAKADRLDESIGITAKTIGAIFGIPLLGYAGKKWVEYKPLKRFRILVGGFQEIRDKAKANGSISPDDMDAILRKWTAIVPKLPGLIDKTKAEIAYIRSKGGVLNIPEHMPISSAATMD